MEVSAQTIREVEFREKLRGYHQEDVDEFLEQVAAAFEQLTARLRDAESKTGAAPAAAAPAAAATSAPPARRVTPDPDGESAEETLRRTLVLAQRTADLAVQEAREEADRIIAEAEQQGRLVMADAESEVRAEVERLSAERDHLVEAVESLTGWLESHRTQFGKALLAAQQALQQGLLVAAPPPIPAPAADETADEVVDGDVVPEADDQPMVESDAVIELGPETPDEDDEHEPDPFFDELRKAVQDTGPLGTIHEDPDDDGPLFDQELVDARRSGRRLRRRR